MTASRSKSELKKSEEHRPHIAEVIAFPGCSELHCTSSTHQSPGLGWLLLAKSFDLKILQNRAEHAVIENPLDFIVKPR